MRTFTTLPSPPSERPGTSLIVYANAAALPTVSTKLPRASRTSRSPADHLSREHDVAVRHDVHPAPRGRLDQQAQRFILGDLRHVVNGGGRHGAVRRPHWLGHQGVRGRHGRSRFGHFEGWGGRRRYRRRSLNHAPSRLCLLEPRDPRHPSHQGEGGDGGSDQHDRRERHAAPPASRRVADLGGGHHGAPHGVGVGGEQLQELADGGFRVEPALACVRAHERTGVDPARQPRRVTVLETFERRPPNLRRRRDGPQRQPTRLTRLPQTCAVLGTNTHSPTLWHAFGFTPVKL